MMRFIQHFKIALSIGLIVGIVSGIIDIVTKIFTLNFEWFEIYQTLFLSSFIFVICFSILSLFVESAIKIFKLKVSKRWLFSFYFITSVTVLLIHYSEIVLTIYILKTGFFDPVNIKASLFLISIIFVIYIIMLSKFKRIPFRLYSILKNEKNKKIIKDFVFIVGIFVIALFLIDLYYLNYSNFSSSEKIENYPNIMLIVWDTVRADHLSCYGYKKITTSNLDRFAEQSVVFENAISATSWTLPSHSSMFTGKYLHNHKANIAYQKLNNKEVTLAEILKEVGYYTVGFTAAGYTKSKYGLGQGMMFYKDRLDFFELQAIFDRFSIGTAVNLFIPLRKILKQNDQKSAEENNNDIFKWLENNKDERFFMFINYYDINNPHTIGKEFRKGFTNETRDDEVLDVKIKQERYLPIPQDIIQAEIDYYDAKLVYLDYHFGRLLEKLNDLGLMNDTIIIVTSDHGEEIYDHGKFGHQHTLYEEIIHVPLMIYYPEKFKAKRIDKRVENMNIFSTVLDILNIKEPQNIDSLSLVPLIKNESQFNRNHTLSELYKRDYLNETEWKALVIDDWKVMIVNPEKETLPSSLFNLESDPEEKKNLYNEEVGKRNQLINKLYKLIKKN